MNNAILIYDSIWSQLGASLDMHENAINRCPEKHWEMHYIFDISLNKSYR